VSNERSLKEIRVIIASDGDLLTVRQSVRTLALELGFSVTETVGIVTALSEMARNMLTYAGRGELIARHLLEQDRHGIVITARDEGPGIPDVQKALLDGYSTSGGLGMGLPGIKRLMDHFTISSELQKGTMVVAEKWLNHR
jgi:serine/threonine-protein kinase RsbT